MRSKKHLANKDLINSLAKRYNENVDKIYNHLAKTNIHVPKRDLRKYLMSVDYFFSKS